MSKYLVILPITGIVSVEVEADSEKDAIERVVNSGEGELPDRPDEWGIHQQIQHGNIFTGMLNKAYAEILEDEED
jgi:hypothetical protein